MMRLPIPTVREVRGSFALAAICALLLTGTLCWGIAHKVSQTDNVLHVAVSAADQVERLSAQLDEQAQANAAQLDLLRQQSRDARRANRASRAQLAALLTYLRAHGINVPKVAYTPQRSSTSGGGGGGSGPPKSPTATAPSPAGPGHSGTHACAHSPKC